MDKITVRGIDVLFDESIPEGEIWLECPMKIPGMKMGGKIRYMFSLLDYRMTQPKGEGSFFLELENKLKTLKNCIEDGFRPAAIGGIDEILKAMDNFKTCKDCRTVPDDSI